MLLLIQLRKLLIFWHVLLHDFSTVHPEQILTQLKFRKQHKHDNMDTRLGTAQSGIISTQAEELQRIIGLSLMTHHARTKAARSTV